MDQSRRGVVRIMEAQAHPLIMAIPRFIQLVMPLLPLKPWINHGVGCSRYGGTGAPSDNGYTKIYSTGYAFAALKADGSITAWGSSYLEVQVHPLIMAIPRFIQMVAFAALKADGSITAWGVRMRRHRRTL
ncbi:hypothetical protein BSPWISOXPB_8181 [uncultured Gammaproteobacteria bacterium]|nr:hypothetical protein BSPWISOXPB_8181 [uncultured Gammaproteobacteria bacterium]